MTESGAPLGSRYVLTEQIGRGGMGVVWRALDRDTGTERAVKILRGELADDPDALTRFVRERTALLRVRHPGVVAVHDMVVEGDRLALVMDLVTGEDLGRYRARRGGTLPPAEAAWLVGQVCAALVAVHGTGLVHRDLKPANVLLDHRAGGEAPARLADFGVAHIVSGTELTAAGQVVGTPSYMAPEVLRGQALSPAADVYAAGVTLYELLAGRPPFRGAELTAVIRAHLEDAPEPIPGVDGRLWTLVEQSLAKEPVARIGAFALAQGLTEYAAAHRTAPYALTPLPAAERTLPSAPGGGTPTPFPAAPPAFPETPPPTRTSDGTGGGTDGGTGGGTGGGTAGRSYRTPVLIGAGAALVAAVAAGGAFAFASGGDGGGSGDGRGLAAAGRQANAAATDGAAAAASPSPTRPHRKPGASASPSESASGPAASRSGAPKRRTGGSGGAKPTGWLCGPRTAADARGHYTTACIRTDGHRVYLRGTTDPVASRNDPKLIASNDVQLVLVLKTADTQKSVQYFTSPRCTAIVCTFEASAVPPHHAYRVLPKFYFQRVYQGTGTESPTIRF